MHSGQGGGGVMADRQGGRDKRSPETVRSPGSHFVYGTIASVSQEPPKNSNIQNRILAIT